MNWLKNLFKSKKRKEAEAAERVRLLEAELARKKEEAERRRKLLEEAQKKTASVSPKKPTAPKKSPAPKKK